MRKLKLFALFAAILFATSMWADDPIGSIDGLTGKNGSFRVWGWALDPDAEDSYAVRIHVYLFTSSTETDLGKAIKGIDAGSANISRPDLASIGHGTMHGFDFNLSITDLNPGTYYVRAYALDKQGVNNPMLGYSAGGEVQAATIGSSYTVSYNANGGSGAPGSQKKAQDVTLKLSTTSPTRTGYTFNGWNTNNSGTGTSYAAGANYTGNANVTLYAKWTANKYTVTLNQQSGSGGSSSVQATYGSAMPSATMPTRTGYTFNGYFDAASGGTQYYKANGSSAKNWDKTAAATLHAQWSIVTYTISCDLKGGAVATANPTSYNVTTNTITLNNPTRAGYTFAGWTGSNGNTPQTTVQITKGSTENKSYTANWTPITYNITYDYAGGQGTNPATYTVETPTFQLAVTRPGYTFLGWTGSNGDVPQLVVEIAKGSTGDKNYVAHWAINPNTTVAYKDSLDNTVAQETVAFNRPEAPEVAGFTFVRWDVVEGPLSEGIKLQAVYAENKPSGAPKKQVGKFTLIRKEGAENEYILQTAK